MSFTKLIAFDRPLAGALLAGQAGRTVGEAELAERTQAAYRQGVDATRAAADQQMVELRADVEQLSDGVLRRLAGVEAAMLARLRESLPGLAVELSRRLLAGYEPTAEVVERICADALDQLFPEREGLEVSLCPRDAALLDQLNPAWLARYPGIRVRPDPTLAPGDCLVRSRFGLTDARQEAKLNALAQTLAGQ
jgi:flagellar assembly protein FliH